MKKVWFILMLAMICWLAAPRAVLAGTLDEMQAAVNSYYASGAITDVDVRATLSDIINKARTAVDADAQAAYRGSFIDVVNASASPYDTRITDAAAVALRAVAQQ